LPIPPSIGASKSLLEKFHTNGINYIPDIMVGAIDPARKIAELDDGREISFDFFLGIPEHCVPSVVGQSGLVFDEWIPVDRKNLKTRYPDVYSIGDVTSVGTPKAGMFAMGAARIAAASIISEYAGTAFTGAYDGSGSCYVEVGEGKVGRVDVEFFSGPAPTGRHLEASSALAEEKRSSGESARVRWFGPMG
jgi:sulfide:quinone oxidoreductase